ncbi:MAG TPA: YihY/virulence factor BrkB family protein [Woeseiaceae bacterium]|jgi:membrane protein|nr:YihY/virulence factor BrkB family protein [Woeseiaceae bacterium]
MFRRIREGGSIGWETLRTFNEHDPFQMAAALSYYTLLSIAPLLLVITGIAGILIGEAEVREALVTQARELVGNQGASLLRTVMQNAGQSTSNILSMILGFGLMILGATTVFAQLQIALNRIWDVRAAPSNALLGFARARLLSLGVVLGLAFLMLASLVLQAVIRTLQSYLESLFPGGGLVSLIANNLLSLSLVALVLAMLFRYVPDVQLSWRHAWIGGFVTAFLLTLGNYAIGLYLGRAAVGSAYGAAGSAVVFMVWVYYTAVILFLGAKTTKVIARDHGEPIVPSEHARFIPGAEPAPGRPRSRGRSEEHDSGARPAPAG